MTGCGTLLLDHGWVSCPNVPAATVTYMCVHEHLRVGRQCQLHLDMLSSCDVCRTCSEPHLCRLRELERSR